MPGEELSYEELSYDDASVAVGIAGNILVRELERESLMEKLRDFIKDIKFIGFFLLEENDVTETIVVDVNESVSEVEVVYETIAPYAVEDEEEDKKC